MSVVKAVLALPVCYLQQIKAYYGQQKCFQEINLFEERVALAEWIENTLMYNTLSFDNPDHHQQIQQWTLDFIDWLKGHINPSAQVLTQFVSGIDYSVPIQLQLYTIMKSCLSEELRLLHDDYKVSMQNIEEKINHCQGIKTQMDQDLNIIQMISSNPDAMPSHPIPGEPARWELETMFSERNEIIQAKKVKQSDLLNDFGNMLYAAIDELQALAKRQFEMEGQFVKILKARIKQNQSISEQTYYNTRLQNVDKIYKTCEKLREFMAILANRTVTRYGSNPWVEPYDTAPDETRLHAKFVILSEAVAQGKFLLKNLIMHAIVIEKQPSNPSQIMKKATKFDIKINIVGGETLLLKQNYPEIKMALIDDKQAEQLARNGTITDEIYTGCGEVIPPGNDKYNRDYDDSLSTLSITVKDLSIPERPPQQSKLQSVLSSKYYILVYTSIKLNEIPFETWTFSTPFVITTNVSQDVKAAATIFWDSYFFDSDPFETLSQAPTPKFKSALSLYIQKETGTKWKLTETNLNYLVYKISLSLLKVDFSDTGSLDKNDFYKLIQERDRNPGREPLFWNWFLASIKIIKEHLSSYWGKGYIVGFIDRNIAEEILPRDAGSFILRFQDSALGSLSASWRHSDGNVYSGIFPIQDKFFPWKSLGNWILEEPKLTNLYHFCPNSNQMILTPKNEAFSIQNSPSIPVPAETVQGANNSILPPRKPYVSSTFTWSPPVEATNNVVSNCPGSDMMQTQASRC